MRCWEFRHCSIQSKQECRAFPFFGTECWKKTGTKCDSGRVAKETLQEKIEFCRKCEFYNEYAEKF